MNIHKIVKASKKIQLAALLLLITVLCYGQAGQIVSDSIQSKSLAETITHENPVRQIAIYLPRVIRHQQDDILFYICCMELATTRKNSLAILYKIVI